MIRKYRSGDLHRLKVQAMQVDEFGCVSEDDFQKLFACFSLVEGDDVLAIFGYDIGDDRKAMCFALLGENCRSKMLSMFRFWQKEIDFRAQTLGVCSVLMTVRENFMQGKRLAKLLKFHLNKRLVRFFNNEDYLLFERNM